MAQDSILIKAWWFDQVTALAADNAALRAANEEGRALVTKLESQIATQTQALEQFTSKDM